jgi:hypothetical protein
MSHSSTAAPPCFRIVVAAGVAAQSAAAVKPFAHVVEAKAAELKAKAVELNFSISLEHATFPFDGCKKPQNASAEWKPSHVIASWAHCSKDGKTGEIHTTSAKSSLFVCKEAAGITAASDLRVEWGGVTAAAAEFDKKLTHTAGGGGFEDQFIQVTLFDANQKYIPSKV